MPKHIVILGGGISGLSAAWFLRRKFKHEVKITILEKTDRAGGWIKTLNKEGYLFELGPHSFRLQSPSHPILELIESLGLQSEMIAADPCAKKRYLYCGKKLVSLSLDPFRLVTSSLGRTLLKGVWQDLWTPRGAEEEETIYQFFARRMGESFANLFIDPLVTGIYAGDPKQLSIRSCFPSIYKWEKNYGGVTKGFLFSPKTKKGGIYSFKEGMETLPKRLANRLQEELSLSKSAVKINSFPDHLEIQLEDGFRLNADHVISTLPVEQLCSILDGNWIQSEGFHVQQVSSVSLGYANEVIDRQGFGYLIPSQEKEKVLGVIWDSLVFPAQNNQKKISRITVMMKNQDSAQAVEISLEALSKHMGINVLPNEIHFQQAAIPQYKVGHAARVGHFAAQLKEIYPRISLAGNSFYGVSIPDCVQQSNLIIQSI